MLKNFCEKCVDRMLFGSKKDREIYKLKRTIIHLVSTVDTYGHMDLYEANLEWKPRRYLRNGDYTMEDRLRDIRRNSIEIRTAAHEAQKVLYDFGTEMIPPNY